MKEKIVLSIIAVFLGLIVTGGAFYIYQMTKTIAEPTTDTPVVTKAPTPTPQNATYLIIENPADEAVSDKKIITISGKVSPGATVIVSSENADQVVTPTEKGTFTLSHTIADGVNLLHITAIFKDGSEQTVTRTITFSTEEF